MRYDKIIGLASVMVLGLSMGTLIVSADEQSDISYQSNGLIRFKTSDNPVDPVDPLDPSKPIEPTNPDKKPGTKGPLSIDFASDFNFGEQSITSVSKEYYASLQPYKRDGQDTTGPNYVQVTDNRGVLTGWKLSVKQDGQFKTEENHELKGAVVVLNNNSLVSDSDSKANIEKSQSVELTPDKSRVIMWADNEQGAGTFLTRWGDQNTADESVILKVPGKSVKMKATYKTTFTWTLIDAPTP